MSETRPIPHWPGYFVDSGGRVYSDWRRVSWHFWEDGTRSLTYAQHPGYRHEMFGRVGKTGYRVVQLRGPGGVRTGRVHMLVLEAFVGPRPDGQQCRHLDGNRLNNALSNLRWGTPTDNQRDRVQHGTSNHGKPACKAKLTPSDVLEIRAACGRGTSLSTLAERFGVTVAAVSRIKLRKCWRNLGESNV